MPRRRVVAKREVLPDPKFGNVTLAKFMNHVMISGKKSVAETIVYGALDIVRERLNKDPLEAFERGAGQYRTHGGSKVPPSGWCYLPGAG